MKFTSLKIYDTINKYGYLLEVDLDYLEDLHDPHNDYPLAPEKKKIKTIEKLVNTLEPKKKICFTI